MIKDFLNKCRRYTKKGNQVRKNIHAYKRKRSDFEKRLEREFLDHGIATIPCKVSGIDDIISSYSVEGYESLSGDFIDYVNAMADLVPEQYPIVLSIVGSKFTENEKNVIRSTIEYDLAYNLGFAEQDTRLFYKMILLFIVGTIISGMLIAKFPWLPDVHIELLYIFFWFFAYTLVEYVFLEGRTLSKQRIKAARLACVKVVFSEEYDECDYSDEEAKAILDGLEKPL